MAKTDLTKSYIAKTFKKLASEQPVQHITIGNIVEACEINRNTFYYHFADKLDLTEWIFRLEFAEILKKELSDYPLISDTEIVAEKYSDLPFYVNTRSEKHNLNLGKFWGLFGNYMLDQNTYYSRVLCSGDCELLSNYLYRIYFIQLRNDILYAARDKLLPQNEITFLASYFTNATVNYVINAVKHINPFELGHPGLYKYDNITHDLIKLVCSSV